MPRPVKLYVASTREGVGCTERGGFRGGGARNVCGALAVYTAEVRARKQSSWRMRARTRVEGRGEKRRVEGVVYARDSASEKFLSGSERFSL